MSFNIEIDNSYCYLDINKDIRLLNIIHQHCSVKYYYFIKDWKTHKPSKKLREIIYYSTENNKFKFPRGWLWDVYESLILLDTVTISDIRRTFKPIPLHSEEVSKLKFYPYQDEAARLAIEYRYGIIHHPTGSGKTITMVNIINQVGFPGIIMVPSLMLMYQTKEVMEKFFPEYKVGLVGDSEFDIGQIIVGTSDSLFLKLSKINDAYKNTWKFLFIDECHHLREAKELNTRYYDASMGIDASMKIGFTATPGDINTVKRRILEGATGGVLHYLSDAEAREYGIIVDMEVYILAAACDEYKRDQNDLANWQFEYKTNMLNNNKYHEQIRDVARSLVAKGLSTLIIVDRVGKHLKVLEEMIPEAEVLYGATEKDLREDIKERFENNEIPLLISTIVKEGVNIKNIEAIIMAGGGKDSDALIQKIGRGLRWKEGKDKLILVDFMFDDGILQKHSKERIKTYKKKDYQIFYVSEI